MPVQSIECQLVRAQIGRYLGGESISQEAMRQLEVHLVACDDCRAALSSRKAELKAKMTSETGEARTRRRPDPETLSNRAAVDYKAIESAAQGKGLTAPAKEKPTRPSSFTKPLVLTGLLAVVLVAMSRMGGGSGFGFGSNAFSGFMAKASTPVISTPAAATPSPAKTPTTKPAEPTASPGTKAPETVTPKPSTAAAPAPTSPAVSTPATVATTPIKDSSMTSAPKVAPAEVEKAAEKPESKVLYHPEAAPKPTPPPPVRQTEPVHSVHVTHIHRTRLHRLVRRRPVVVHVRKVHKLKLRRPTARIRVYDASGAPIKP